MHIRIIHDREGRIDAVVATNAPEGITLLPADLSGRLVSELKSHTVGGTDHRDLISKLREIRESKLTDLDTHQITPS